MHHSKFLSAALLFVFTSSAWSAQVRVVNDFLGAPVIEITGEIQSGDLKKIHDVAAKVVIGQTDPMSLRKPLRFQMNTPGGDVLEAIKIGQFFRDTLASVQSYGKLIYALGSKEEQELASKRGNPEYEFLSVHERLTESHIVRNHSSGILMFYGGVKRAHRDNADFRNAPRTVAIPVIGVHRPYYSKEYYAGLSPAQAQDAYAKLEALVRAYLEQMGAPQALIDRMFVKASNEIELISADEFRKLYKAEESFYQEWLLARCGAKGAEHVLVEPGLSDFRRIESFQISARLKDGPLTKPIGYRYPDSEYPLPYIESLYRQIQMHNAKVENCAGTSVNEHQLGWAKKFIDQTQNSPPKR